MDFLLSHFNVSNIINLLLVLVTLFTVKYARKTLLMEHSSQIVVTYTRVSSNIKRYYPFRWDTEVQNIGNGHILKLFILLTLSSNKKIGKQYFLSKPIVSLNPGEKRWLRLSLTDDHMSKTDRNPEKEKIEIIYQDTLNNLYSVKPSMVTRKKPNYHLESLYEMPKRMHKFTFRFWLYKWKIKKSIKQGNSYPQRLKFELDKKYIEYEEIINLVQNKQKEDTK